MLPQTQAEDSQRNKPCSAFSCHGNTLIPVRGVWGAQRFRKTTQRNAGTWHTATVTGWGAWLTQEVKQVSEVFGSAPLGATTRPATAWLLAAGHHGPRTDGGCSAAARQKHHCGDFAQRSDCKRQPIFKFFFPKSFRDGGGFRNISKRISQHT